MNPSAAFCLQLRSAEGLAHGHAHRVELVIARHLLDQRPAAVVVEDDEIADQGHELRRRADALQHHLQLGHVRVGQGLAADGAPGLEPLPPGGERADARLGAVGDHERLVHGEQGG